MASTQELDIRHGLIFSCPLAGRRVIPKQIELDGDYTKVDPSNPVDLAKIGKWVLINIDLLSKLKDRAIDEPILDFFGNDISPPVYTWTNASELHKNVVYMLNNRTCLLYTVEHVSLVNERFMVKTEAIMKCINSLQICNSLSPPSWNALIKPLLEMVQDALQFIISTMMPRAYAENNIIMVLYAYDFLQICTLFSYPSMKNKRILKEIS